MREAENTIPERQPAVSLSIVVNNYNYARFLQEALDSSLRQMQPNDELIVVDDGSTDESQNILHRYAQDQGVTVIVQKNQGQMRAVRVGIEAAQRDIVVLLDSDDYFLDGYLDRLRQTYAAHPEVAFVFANAMLGGDAEAGIDSMRKILAGLELTPGIVGSTKWATLLFHEFVGFPTSGNSLRRALAKESVSLPETVDETSELSPLVARLLGISDTECAKSGYTADGVIVRCASILGAIKYFDDRPGFFYRIHGDNKYATSSRVGRWYLRRRRKKQFRMMVRQHFSISGKPTTSELHREILGRNYARRQLRRLIISACYCRSILFSTGTAGEKLSVLAAAINTARQTRSNVMGPH
jgi:glycosyltransferase involved in cell wall biosynthesis